MQNKLLFPELHLFYPFILIRAYFGLTIFYIGLEFLFYILIFYFLFYYSIFNFSTQMSFLQKYTSPTQYNQYNLKTLTQIKQPYQNCFLDGCTQRIKTRVGNLKLEETKYILSFISLDTYYIFLTSCQKKSRLISHIMHFCRRVKKDRLS